MKKQFILIDQSIRDSSGHHLEYALRVLAAAKRKGFRTTLAVNNACDPLTAPDVDHVSACFTYDFWENAACTARPRNKARKLGFHAFSVAKQRLHYQLAFSRFGMARTLISRGESPASIITRYQAASDSLTLPSWLVVVAAATVTVESFGRHVSRHAKPVLAVTRPLVALGLKFIKLIAGILVSPVLIVSLVLRWTRSRRAFMHFSRTFATECRQLLAQTGAAAEDVVFVPTLGDAEVKGITQLASSAALPAVFWHLLFRRNLFSGRQPAYQQEVPATLKSRLLLAELRRCNAASRIFCYTDTDPLSEQWNLLGGFTFSTLPIPHDSSLRKQQKPSPAPLVVSYLGDARDEKGFQHLSQLVRDVRARGIAAKDMTFRFQSNFNIPKGDAASRISKSQLAVMRNDGVTLIDGPFDSATYADLLNTSDILLIPYNERHYYARSSGVFAEALVAGIPTIHPFRSWMGRELLSTLLDHHNTVIEKSKSTGQYQCVGINKVITPISVGKSKSAPLLCVSYTLLAPCPGIYARVSVYRTRRHSGPKPHKHSGHSEDLDLVGKNLLDLRSANGHAIVPLPSSGSFIAKIEWVDQDASSKSFGNGRNVFQSIEFGLADAHTLPPLQRVGYAYDSEDDLCDALLQVAAHYSEYEAASKAYSADWSRFHNADHLVDLLSKASTRT
jgi:hypothetical protein